MAQCSGPISPAENPPGPSGLNQVEQEKEKSPQQPSRSGLFENSGQEYIENADNFMETEAGYDNVAAPQLYQDSDSDDGLDVVYGPNSNPPSGSRMIQRPLYNQDCATNTTSCNLPRPSSSRNWNHEGEHYGYSYPSYPRLSRVHPQDYTTYYDHPPSFRPSRYISIRDWPEGSQSTQSSSRYPHSDPHDPYDLGYPPILRHPPTRHRPRRHNLDVANPRIPYHTRPIPEIDMDFLDYDQIPPTSMAEGIRRSAPNPEVMLPIRQEQQRQVIMRHASTSTPPMPSLRQHASTSTQPSTETSERKRSGPKNESTEEVPVKRAKVDNSSQPSSQDTVTVNVENVTSGASTEQPIENNTDRSVETSTQAESEQSSDFLLCTENLPVEDAEADEDSSLSQQSVSAPLNTSENGASGPPSENQEQNITVTTSPAASSGNSTSVTTSTKSSGTRTETRTVPASAIEFVTSTLKPRSKPGSNQTSRKTSPNTSRASPVHVAAYSQEALRDLVCATLAPAAAANLIKSEKREKKDRESSTRTSPDPIDDPQPGPSGLQRVQSTEEVPGPSGTQQQLSRSPSSDLQADDLQLDCLSSDTEGSSSEDVQVVKISRRKKSSKKPVEVDLTQEMTSDDDGEVVIEEVRSRPVSVPEHSETEDPENKTEITVKTFASVPDNVTNIQSSSRGSTPAAPTTLFDTYQQQLASSTGADSAWAGTVPPPYHHRDHGYHRHNRHSEHQPESVRQSRNSTEPQMEGIRPVDLRPEDPVVMDAEERPEAAIADPWIHDMHYRPRRLRHPCVYRQSSSHSCPSACPCSRQSGRHQHQQQPSWPIGSTSRPTPQAHGSGHQSQYTNPPPAHRASLCPNTNAMDPHNILTSSQMPGSRPGPLLRAVQRMNPRHQRLYHMQQQTTEQQRRWSVRAPPPPYPSTAVNASAEGHPGNQPPAAQAATCTEGSTATSQHQEQRGRHQHPSTAAATSHTAGHLLSVPRVIMSRPNHAPFMHLRRGHSHNSTNQQYMGPPNQSVPPPPLAGRGGQGLPPVDPPPAHQPPPPRFPEEVQLPDSRRARPRRWHIPTMGDPHPPYHHPEVEPVPLVMDHPMYHPPPYPPNMIPPNAHHGSMGPVMDPHQLDPAGVPLGRDNLAYGPMLNILFQPHRMGGLEVNLNFNQAFSNLFFPRNI